MVLVRRTVPGRRSGADPTGSWGPALAGSRSRTPPHYVDARTFSDVPEPAAPATAAAARFVGQSVHRKEDRRLLTGHGQYVDDVALPGMLHGAFLRSEVARATITGLDVTAARELPGVVAVYTWAEFDGVFGDSYNTMLGEALTVPPPLAIGDVRHVGDPIAFVVAESRYVAEDVCDLIELDLDVLPPVVDYASAAADTDNLVHGSWGLESNAMVAMPFMPLAGDLDDAFAGAAHVVELTVEQNRYIPVPMETRGIVASYVPGREQLDIVCATQSVHETRNFFARYLRIPEGSVHVTANDVGGGFGQKMYVFREECAVVLASRLLARPVKWIEDRRRRVFPVCTSVRHSVSSSTVPKPPGRTTYAEAKRTNIILRAKK